MSDSLQEQLRALGLAQNKPKQRSDRRRRKPRAKQPTALRKAGGDPGRELSLDEAYALRDREERRQAERARQAKLAEERRRREINEKIRAIVQTGRVNRDDGDVPRNFLFKGRIRKIYVTADQQRALSAGDMGIVYLSGDYHLLAGGPLEEVREISADHVVELPDEAPGEDEHPVPDDLKW